MIRNIQFFISGLMMLAGVCDATPERYRTGIVEEAFLYETADFPSCHSATIAETPEGLVAAFFGGTYERHPDVCIYVCRKIADGWTAPVEVANGIQDAETRLPTWNPVLFQIPGGELLLFYKVGPSPSTWEGRLMRSADKGKTWSTPEVLPEGILGPIKNKPVLVGKQRLLCPSSSEGEGWQAHFEITDDWGKTWSKVGPINDRKVYEVIQPTLLQYPEGKLQMLCRSKNAVIAEAWSKDGGQSWSLVQASALPNNNSGIDAVTLQDGRSLLVYNHVKTPQGASKGYRTPLNVAISPDGVHWSAALILEDSPISQYSYPAVIQSSDGMVHIVYTWRREKIKYVKLDPALLTGVPIVNEKWPE